MGAQICRREGVGSGGGEGEQQQTSQGWGALGEAQGGWRRQQIKEKEDGRKGNQAL